MDKNIESRITDKKSLSRDLSYNNEFKILVHKNPGILRKALDAMDEIDKNINETVEGENFEARSTGKIGTYYIKMGDEIFFVKRERGPYRFGLENEIKSSLSAKELLKDLPWVQITDVQFGYMDNKKSFAIAKWDDRLDPKNIIFLHKYLSSLDSDPDKESYINEIRQKVKIITERLETKFFDILSNMYYDQKNEKIVMFDIKQDRKNNERNR